MAANIGSGGGAHIHFNDRTAEAPQAKKEPSKAEPSKSILKATAPVAPPPEEQVRRERIKAEFLRGALGAAPPQTKKVLDVFADFGKQQSARLKPEMKNQADAKDEAKEDTTTSDKP